MKPFAFLINTPDFAREENYGQFNGYIAFPARMWEKIVRDKEYGEFILPLKVLDTWCEITLSDPKMTFKKFGSIIPVTAIPEEAANGEPFCVFGYDTCHLFNSWEENDYEHEAKITREWLRLAVEIWADELKDEDQFDLKAELAEIKAQLSLVPKIKPGYCYGAPDEEPEEDEDLV